MQIFPPSLDVSKWLVNGLKKTWLEMEYIEVITYLQYNLLLTSWDI